MRGQWNGLKADFTYGAEIRLPTPTEREQNHWRLSESRDKQTGRSLNISEERVTSAEADLSKTWNLDLRARGANIILSKDADH